MGYNDTNKKVLAGFTAYTYKHAMLTLPMTGLVENTTKGKKYMQQTTVLCPLPWKRWLSFLLQWMREHVM